MTTAVLSFTTPGRVTFRCDELHIDDRRNLDENPPFAEWSQAYATGYWNSDVLLGIGLTIGRWLDEPQQWLRRLIQGIAPVVLTIETSPHPNPTEKAALDAPWELLAVADPSTANPMAVAPGAARDVGPDEPKVVTELMKRLGPIDPRMAHYLALDPGLQLTTVRRMGAAANPRPSSKYRLSVVFMGAQPDGMLGLQVDREESAIRRAAGSIGMDLAVEDSGDLARLGELVAEIGECDVLHLSAHGSMRDKPVIVLEGAGGERADATADDLSLGVGTKPRLMFLSACSTARASDVLWSLSVDLCRRGWPAVLGWSGGVSDAGAIELASALYRQLALRVPLTEALAQARMVVARTPLGTEWHKARLFLGPSGGGLIVDSTKLRPGWPDIVGGQEFLDSTRKIRVAGDGSVFPQRRSFQRVMMSLRNGEHAGVVIHGGDEPGRATFAGRVLRRMEPDRKRVVIAREFDASAILDAIRVQIARDGVEAIASQYREVLRTDPSQLLQALRAIIEGPCRSSGDGAFILLLYGFDPMANAETQADGRHALSATQLTVARALIGAFSGADSESRLVFTSAAPFSIPTGDGDQADSLLSESLRC